MNEDLPTSHRQRDKQRVWALWQAMDNADPRRVDQALDLAMAPDLVFHGHDPINRLDGLSAFKDHHWNLLRLAFPDLVRQTHIFMAGRSNGRRDGDVTQDGRHWVSGTGLMNGTFVHDYLGLPATGQRVSLRWGEFCRIEAERVVEIYFLIDMVDLMQQTGLPVLPPASGHDGLWPAPRAADGVLLAVQDEVASAYSLDHIRRFIFQGLNRYDQADLRSMGMAQWFAPRVHWFGPGGIGACLNFREFEELHQRPWLAAFPGRTVQDLDALIAEGAYSGGPGWAGVHATHSGAYLGCPATGRPVQINGMDWWKREGEQYTENWVFVDMLHLFRQFGIDLLERARGQVAAMSTSA